MKNMNLHNVSIHRNLYQLINEWARKKLGNVSQLHSHAFFVRCRRTKMIIKSPDYELN